MTYKLFIDDERFPPDDSNEWLIARSSNEAIDIVIKQGTPNFISFDHDLGGDDTAMRFIWFLIESHIEGSLDTFPTNYYVHSQNPIGVQNIKGLMDNYIRTLSNDEG